jgi:hypothetical protein
VESVGTLMNSGGILRSTLAISGQRRIADFPAIGSISQAQIVAMTAFLPCKASSTAATPKRMRLFKIGLRCQMAGRTLQVIGQRPVILVAQLVLDQLRDDLADAAQLRMPEGILGAGLGDQLAVGIGQTFGNGDRAVAVLFDALIDASQETLGIERNLREEQDVRRLAGALGCQAARQR